MKATYWFEGEERCSLCDQSGTEQQQFILHRNWVICELRENGMPSEAIATLFGLSDSSVSMISHGREPIKTKGPGRPVSRTTQAHMDRNYRMRAAK